jgi:hypothetical protein
MSSSGHLHPAAAVCRRCVGCVGERVAVGLAREEGPQALLRAAPEDALLVQGQGRSPTAPCPSLPSNAQKSLILTNSRKISKTPKKPGVVIASEKEKSYELFAATPEEADRWFALLVHAQALPMGAIGGATATKDTSPPGSPAAPRNPSPAQIQQQQQQPQQPQMVRSPSRGPAQRGPPDGAVRRPMARAAQSSAAVGSQRCRQAGAPGAAAGWWQRHDV